MTPPTPAAVRCGLTHPKFEGVTIEEAEALAGDPRTGGEVLRDHIRAIAQEMRDHAEKYESDGWYTAGESLRVFADKLEGKQP